jgi:hypothetical protein
MAQILPFSTSIAASNVVSPLAHFVRLGEAHKKLSELHAAGRLPASRVVVDASRFRVQRELIKSLQQEGAEIVLDTEAAELAAPLRFSGHASRAPWALPGRSAVLGPDFFLKDSKIDVIRDIARFAVENGIDVVLAPTHFLGDRNFAHWFEIDRAACVRLRAALDAAGGKNIAIDYPLIISHVELNAPQVRGTFVQGLSDLPIDNLWIRASGLSSDIAPDTLKRYINALGQMHNLGLPIIADHLGGLAGNAAMASGVISGHAHGIGERERFDANSWHKLPPERSDDDEFGRTVRISLVGLNKSLTVSELELLTKAKGGRRVVSCGDPNCCPHGYEDMIKEPRGHAAYQAFSRHEALQRVPDLRRMEYFLVGPMADAERETKKIAALRPPKSDGLRLNIDPEKLMVRLHNQSIRLSKLKRTMEKLEEQRGSDASRARPVKLRRNSEASSKETKK